MRILSLVPLCLLLCGCGQPSAVVVALDSALTAAQLAGVAIPQLEASGKISAADAAQARLYIDATTKGVVKSLAIEQEPGTSTQKLLRIAQAFLPLADVQLSGSQPVIVQAIRAAVASLLAIVGQTQQQVAAHPEASLSRADKARIGEMARKVGAR